MWCEQLLRILLALNTVNSYPWWGSQRCLDGTYRAWLAQVLDLGPWDLLKAPGALGSEAAGRDYVPRM